MFLGTFFLLLTISDTYNGIVGVRGSNPLGSTIRNLEETQLELARATTHLKRGRISPCVATKCLPANLASMLQVFRSAIHS